MSTYKLTVNINDGRNFPFDFQGIKVVGQFAGRDQHSHFSFGQGFHKWHETLTWTLSKTEFQKHNSSGLNTCKLNCVTQDGAQLGWVVLNLRTAKLNVAYKHRKSGEYMGLLGSWYNSLTEVPEINVQYYLELVNQRDQKQNIEDTTLQEKNALCNEKSQKAGKNQSIQKQETVLEEDNDDYDGSMNAPLEFMGNPAQTLEPAPDLPTTPFPEMGEARKFKFSLDLKSFFVGPKLPQALATFIVLAHFPDQLFGYQLKSIKTNPPVQIPRGTEGTLPAGKFEHVFSSGVVTLAQTLTQNPRIRIEAWVRDQYREDKMVGVGTVPLVSLLKETNMDGYAPIYAKIYNKNIKQDEGVQIGAVRVVVRLEEGGSSVQSQPYAMVEKDDEVLYTQNQQDIKKQHYKEIGIVDVDSQVTTKKVYPSDTCQPITGMSSILLSELSQQQDEIFECQQKDNNQQAQDSANQQTTQCVQFVSTNNMQPTQQQFKDNVQSIVSHPPHQQQQENQATQNFSALATSSDGKNDSKKVDVDELVAAMKLEQWKRHEEGKWRKLLHERERQRLGIITEEVNRREGIYTSQLDRQREQLSHQISEVKQLSKRMEQREKVLVASEESLLRRKNELERKHEQSMSDIEMQVRSLQKEFEQQYQMDKQKINQLQKENVGLKQQLEHWKLKTEEITRDFEDYKIQYQLSPGVVLDKEVTELKKQLESCKLEVSKQQTVKKEYKEQVLQLKQEITQLQHEKQLNTYTPTFWQPQQDSTCQQVRESCEDLVLLKKELQRLKAEALKQEYGPKRLVNQGCQVEQVHETDIQSQSPQIENVNPIFEEQKLRIACREPKHPVQSDLDQVIDNGQKDTGVNGTYPTDFRVGVGNLNFDENYVVNELERLQTQKSDLLNTGLYNDEDVLIKHLDQRIAKLQGRYCAMGGCVNLAF